MDVLVVAAARALDAWLGEPPRFHPLAGFGQLATTIEHHLYRDSGYPMRGYRTARYRPFEVRTVAVQGASA